MSKVRAEQYTNRAGSGAPEIPYGVTVPSGASIDGAGGLNLTGIATAGTFKGNLTGDVSGNVTGVAATFTGPVTIGGTLTYEDVTNIDAVGLITARDGIKVTGGNIVGNNSTNVSGISSVTATNFYGSGANLTGVDALPTVSGSASGAIAANRAVLLKNDGTYEQVTGVNQNMGSTRSFFDQYSVIAGAYNPDLSNFAFLYQDIANGQYTTSVVGSISGTTITWGTPQVARSENPGRDTMALTYDPSQDLYVGVTCQSSNSYKPRVLIGTASGTSISWNDWGNPAFYQNTYCDWMDSCYNTKNNRIGLIYCNNNASVIASEFTVTSNNVTVVGTDFAWSSSGYGHSRICWDSTNECYLVAATKTNNNNYGAVRVMNPGGFASPPGNQWDVGVYKKIYGLEHDPNAGQTCLLFWNTSNGNVFLQSTTSVNTSNGVINPGTEVQVNSGSPDGGTFKGAGMTYDPNAKKFVITYSYATGSWARTASVSSAGVISLDSIMTINAGQVYSDDNAYSIANVFDSSSNKVATVYQDYANMIGNGGRGGYGRVITTGSTNLDADKYIGFSAASVSNGQTVKVKTKSNTVTQAGLTTSSRSYIQSADGTVGSSPSNPSVDVGIALNSNTVLLQ